MGGKKQAIAIYKGSLKSHWMKYINQVDMKLNPADTIGSSMGSMMLRTVHRLDSKFVQPGFKFNHTVVWDSGYYEPSILNLKFVNGYERSYNMALSPFNMIKFEIDWINNMVEFERSMGGNDDELEDDVK